MPSETCSEDSGFALTNCMTFSHWASSTLIYDFVLFGNYKKRHDTVTTLEYGICSSLKPCSWATATRIWLRLNSQWLCWRWNVHFASAVHLESSNFLREAAQGLIWYLAILWWETTHQKLCMDISIKSELSQFLSKSCFYCLSYNSRNTNSLCYIRGQSKTTPFPLQWVLRKAASLWGCVGRHHTHTA